MKLTTLEIKILNAMRDNEYNDALDDNGTWTFTVIDNSGIDAKVARGVISSLVKKELITVYEATAEANPVDMIAFTDKGAKLFNTADGKDCTWGGAKLLKEAEATKTVTKAKEKKEEGAYTLLTIANEVGMDSKKARKILRANNMKRKGSSWQWATKEEADKIKNMLALELKAENLIKEAAKKEKEAAKAK